MPYNPGISYRGDQYLSAGISDAADSISKYFRDKRAEQDELEMQRGVLLGRYGSDGQFSGSERLGEPPGAAGEPGYGGAPMNQADAGVAEQLGENAGAAGEPGASGGGIFGMFGRSNRPTATAKTKATDSQTAESKGFKGLQAFASSEYNIPLEATTAMSKNALKGFLVGLEQRRTAEGQDQDRDLRQRQFADQQKLTGAQINHYAALDQDRAAQQAAREDQLRRAARYDEAMQPTGSMPGLQQFASMGDTTSLNPGTLSSFAAMPAVVKQPDREQIARAFLQYGTDGQRAEGAKMLFGAVDRKPVVTKLGGRNVVFSPETGKFEFLDNELPSEKPTVTVEEKVNGVPVKRNLTSSQFEVWKTENPDKATAGFRAKLKELRAAQAAGKKVIDLEQLINNGSVDLSPWWGGKPIEDGIKYLESLLGGNNPLANIPQEHIDYAKKNPGKRDSFAKRYGDAAAAAVFGN